MNRYLSLRDASTYRCRTTIGCTSVGPSYDPRTVSVPGSSNISMSNILTAGPGKRDFGYSDDIVLLD